MTVRTAQVLVAQGDWDAILGSQVWKEERPGKQSFPKLVQTCLDPRCMVKSSSLSRWVCWSPGLSPALKPSWPSRAQESDQVLPGQTAGEWPLGPPGSGLEVLVYLSHVLHHALPVGPVGVQHGAELLQEKGAVTGAQTLPEGLVPIRAVPPRSPTHGTPRQQHQDSGKRISLKKCFLPTYSGDTVPFKKQQT